MNRTLIGLVIASLVVVLSGCSTLDRSVPGSTSSWVRDSWNSAFGEEKVANMPELLGDYYASLYSRDREFQMELNGETVQASRVKPATTGYTLQASRDLEKEILALEKSLAKLGPTDDGRIALQTQIGEKRMRVAQLERARALHDKAILADHLLKLESATSSADSLTRPALEQDVVNTHAISDHLDVVISRYGDAMNDPSVMADGSDFVSMNIVTKFKG